MTDPQIYIIIYLYIIYNTVNKLLKGVFKMTNEIKQGEDLMSRNEDFDVDFNTFKEIRNKSTDLFEALHNAFLSECRKVII